MARTRPQAREVDLSNAYDEVSAAYEHGRPAYAPAAVAHVTAALGLAPGAIVLDLGAGTGKLTRMLEAEGLAVVAVDPSRAMLDELEATTERARALVATAEALPLADGSVGAVVAAQAFHWFDPALALPEMHRVLEPGGGVALLWNKRNDDDPVQRLLAELTNPPERNEPRGWELDIPAILAAADGLFEPASLEEFPHVQPTSAAGLLDRLRSSSFVASLPPDRQRGLEQELESRLDALGHVRELAHRTIVYVARRAD